MCLAIPGKILSVQEESSPFRSGVVDFGGIQKEVNLTFVPEAKKDDFVIVHVGVALHTVHETEAKRMLETLNQMGAMDEIRG